MAGSLCCVLGQDTLLSQCLSSTQEYKWVPANYHGNLTKCLGVAFDGLASHPGEVAIVLVASCYGNRDKLRLCGPLGSCADFTFNLYLVRKG